MQRQNYYKRAWASEHPYGDVEITAKQTLKVAGVIRSAGQQESRINEIMTYVLKRPLSAYDWKTFFGKSHRHAERMAIFLRRNFETNIDAFLVQMDSYCDLITGITWARLKPGKNYPAYGHAIKDATLAATLPNTMAAFQKLHDLRLQSATAHPRTLKTGKPTRLLKHKDFHLLRPDLINAFSQFEMVIKP